jgi:hypothetical protein
MLLRHLTVSTLLAALPAAWAIDQNNNQQSDVWELASGASGSPAAADADGDGFTNATESLAGTNPLSALDFPAFELDAAGPDALRFHWQAVPGKAYALLASSDLSAQGRLTIPLEPVTETGGTAEWLLSGQDFSRRFYQLSVTDVDSDGDGFTYAEERLLGFDPERTRTER